MNWVILHSLLRLDYYDGPLFWSNTDGWGSLATATVFSDSEQNEFTNLPVESWGWVELPPLSAYP
jgi:hypothetical protein